MHVDGLTAASLETPKRDLLLSTFNRAVVLVGFALVVCATSACGPSRPVIPPGEIPSLPRVSSEDERYGQTVLSELTRQYPLERDDRDINRVRDIVSQLARAAYADNEPWHVFVLQGDSVVNAAATRGNFVMVWTGLLRLAQSDGELATVLAHELGHLLAGHTEPTAAEEASSIIAQTSGNIAGRIVATQGPYGALASITGVLVTEAIKAIAVNPESQRQELEADQIGFFLMADAGFDPQEALSIWTTLATKEGAGSSLQFLSSHPANEERLQALGALLPAAQQRYDAARLHTKQERKASPAAERDSFSFGRDSALTNSQQQPAPADRQFVIQRPPTRTNSWTVVEPNASVRLAPFKDATVTTTLSAGTSVAIKARVGLFYEITSPIQGFISTEAVSPSH